MILLFVTFQCLVFVVCLFAQVYADITVHVSGAVVNQSRKACLVCEVVVEGPLEGPEFKWFRNKMILKDSSTVSIQNTELGSQLCFTFIDETTLGEYMCAVNAAGITTGNTTDLESIPFFKKPHRSRTVVEGQNLKITCQSWGFPVPEVTWIFNDAPLFDPRARVSTKAGDIGTNSVISTMELSRVTARDRGYYKCHASNSNGALTNYPTRARIKGQMVPVWPFVGFFSELCLIAFIILVVEIRRIHREKRVAAKANYDTQKQQNQNKPARIAPGTPSAKS